MTESSDVIKTTAIENDVDVCVYERRKRYLVFKRIIDILGATVGLILFSPVFLILPMFYLFGENKGPVFFKQKRVGKDGVDFTMYKFRTMCVDAEKKLPELMSLNEVEGPMFKIRDDPRITKVGKFLRKTSLDELPQFVNVLKGDMSLVGPRPPLRREVDSYSEYDKQRLSVLPGCTGLWQVSGRDSFSFSVMVALDLQYIQEVSFVMDMKIIFKTLKIMILRKASY